MAVINENIRREVIIVMSECRYCGSRNYGSGCPHSPNRIHEHISDGDHCDFCGSSNYGRGCPHAPNGIHRHGHGHGCVWCGSRNYGSGCPHNRIHVR